MVIGLSRLTRTPRYYDNTFRAGALTLRGFAYLCVDVLTGSPGKTPRLCSYSAFRECRLIYVVAGFPASAMLTPHCVRAGDGPPQRAFFPWCFYQQPERETFERLLARRRGIQDYAAYRSKDSDQHNNARAVAHYLRQARCAGNLIIASLQRFRPRKQSAFMPVMLMRYLWKKPRVST
ncbi:hypothetical protein ACMSW1_001101 [Cronobacter dublinensis]